MRGLWRRYQNALSVRPILTKVPSAATIFFCSDLVTQRLTRDDNRPSAVDFHRASSGAAFGVVGTAYVHFWWNILERVVEARFPVYRWGRLKNAAAKVFIDQSVSAPLYYYGYYFVTNVLKPREEEGGGEYSGGEQFVLSLITDRVKTATERASDMLWPTMTRHWTVWPPIHLANFYFIPLKDRVLVQNLVLVFWSGYLSHLNHGKEQIDSEVREKTADSDVMRGEIKLKLKRRKTVITGLDVVVEEVND